MYKLEVLIRNKLKPALLLIIVKLFLLSPKFLKAMREASRIFGWISEPEIFNLYKLSLKTGKTAVEIGSYLGKSTSVLANTCTVLYSIDPHTGDKTEVDKGLQVDTWDAFLINMARHENVIPIRAASEIASRSFMDEKITLIFIDGWHSTEAVMKDIKSWSPHCSKMTTWIFDDFIQDQVSDGIIQNLNLLPKFLGVIGKQIVFSNNHYVRCSFMGFLLKINADRENLNKYSQT